MKPPLPESSFKLANTNITFKNYQIRQWLILCSAAKPTFNS